MPKPISIKSQYFDLTKLDFFCCALKEVKLIFLHIDSRSALPASSLTGGGVYNQLMSPKGAQDRQCLVRSPTEGSFEGLSEVFYKRIK